MEQKMPMMEFAWYGHVIGRFEVRDNGKIEWQGQPHPYKGLFDGETATSAPTLLRHMAPEGWLNNILKSPDRADYIKSGIRFLSNITLSESAQCVYETLELDRVMVPLAASRTAEGVFTGIYNGPSPSDIQGTFVQSLATYWKSRTMPKFSGIQMKLPVSVYPGEDGQKPVLMPANSGPFSHIVKFPGTSFHEPMAALEWMGLELAEKAGMPTCQHALIDFGAGAPPALLVERFDIPQHEEDRNQYLIADFTTLTGKDPKLPNFKYGENAEMLGRKLLEISSDPSTDAEFFFKRNAFAWFSGDHDTHMKNISVLRTIDADTGKMNTRLAPVYDTLCTVALPSKGDQNISLKIGGKDGDIRLANFVRFGRSIGIEESRVEELLRDVAEKTAKNAVAIASDPPSLIAANARCAFALRHAATEIVDRVKAFGFDTPEWESTRPDAGMRKEMKAFSRRESPSMAMR